MVWRLAMGAILILAADVYADRGGGSGAMATWGRGGGGNTVGGMPAARSPQHSGGNSMVGGMPAARDLRHGGGAHGGSVHGGRPREGVAVSYRNDDFSLSVSLGNRWPRPHHPREVWSSGWCRPAPRYYCPPPFPRCPPRPIIRYIGCDLRVYQPAVWGHPSLVQRWCPSRREWITIETRHGLDY
jgi:hypothetical protein